MDENQQNQADQGQQQGQQAVQSGQQPGGQVQGQGQQQARMQAGTTQLSHRVAAAIGPQVDQLYQERLAADIEKRFQAAHQQQGGGQAQGQGDPQGAQQSFGGDFIRKLVAEGRDAAIQFGRSELPVIVNLVIQALQNEGAIAPGYNVS